MHFPQNAIALDYSLRKILNLNHKSCCKMDVPDLDTFHFAQRFISEDENKNHGVWSR